MTNAASPPPRARWTWRPLEQHLGVRLLQRTTRRLSLSQAGDRCLERVRAILADLDEADAMVQSEIEEMSGTVRVLAPPVARTASSKRPLA